MSIRRSNVAAFIPVLLATFFVPVAAANAAPEWKPCISQYVAYDCANFELPLDRTGVVTPTTTVRAVKQSAMEGPRAGTMFVIAGGPGQTAELMIGLVNQLLPGANRSDLIAVDQRGTGRSEPLNCPRLETGAFLWDGNDPTTDQPFTDCSIALGPARAAYNTAEAAADIEAVRAFLGVPSVTLFGVSYGTKVALAYAKAHPSNTAALLLDSVLPTDKPDALNLDSVEALRTALATICRGNRCKGMGSTAASLAKLSEQLTRNPIDGMLVMPDFKIEQFKIGATELLNLISSADLNPFVFTQLPSALRAALHGESAALTRLYAIANGAFAEEDDLFAARRTVKKLRRSAPPLKRGADGSPSGVFPGRATYEDLAIFSYTAFFATTCADLDSPWQRSEQTSGRQAAIDSAVAAISPDAAWPLPRSVISAASPAAACRGWQQRPALPDINQGPLPDIPTLALSGDLDMRTPKPWADRSVQGNPRAQSIAIPNTGHSVIGSDLSGCASSLAKRFLLFGTTDGRCRKTARPLSIAPLPARSLRSVKQRRGSCRGLRGSRCLIERKRLTAGYLALRDTFDQILIGNTTYGVGLIDGSWEFDLDFEDESDSLVIPLSLRINGISSVPGVSVSGSLAMDNLPQVSGVLTINGRRVQVSGRVDYYADRDRLTLSTRSRGKSARIQVTARRGAANTAGAPTQRRLGLRQTFALASGQRR